MVCERCGIEEDTRRMEQRKERKIAILCVSCSARPAKTIRGPLDTKCIPWHGDFDVQDNPLNADGFKFMPGTRLCKHRDCVNPDHLVVAEVD